jgi:hypothetical protein
MLRVFKYKKEGKKMRLVITVLVSAIGGFLLAYIIFSGGMNMGSDMGGMDGMEVAAPPVPAVKGYTEGEAIAFIHTEVSDPEVGKLMTDMMGSPVPVVPSLAEVPESLLANVYVFKNGVKGTGPMGFQPDVFDYPPNTEKYTPLRDLKLVTWKDEGSARELKSVEEVKEAEKNGDLTIERPGVVVNIPFLTWPGGQR